MRKWRKRRRSNRLRTNPWWSLIAQSRSFPRRVGFCKPEQCGKDVLVFLQRLKAADLLGVVKEASKP